MTTMPLLLPILLLAVSFTSPPPAAADPPSRPPYAAAPSQPSRLPTFLIPDDHTVHPDWPANTWPREMAQAVRSALHCDPCRPNKGDGQCSSCNSVTAVHVNLGSLGEGAVASQEEEHCGQGGNCYTFVVLFRDGGHWKAETFADAGSSGYSVVRGNGPVPAFIATYDVPCCMGTAERYSFQTGHFVQTGCDDITFTDSLWDMKHASIKPCHF